MDDLQALLRPLVEQPETAPPPLEWFARRARRRTYRRRGLTAATAVLMLATPLWLVSRRDSPSELRVSTGSSTTTSPTVTISPTVPGGPFGPNAPWAGDPLPASAAPTYLEAAAAAPDVAASCPLLAPVDLGEGAGATARVSTFGDNAWSVEYDLPGAPGPPADGAVPTADSGRGTFAVTASLMPPPLRDLPPPWGDYDSLRARVEDLPQTRIWSDGSIAGWGHSSSPGSPGAPVSHAVNFQLPDADPMCIYTTESFLGEAHALHLAAQLRRIDTEG